MLIDRSFDSRIDPDTALEEERHYLNQVRNSRTAPPHPNAQSSGQIGIALSGGGVRAATFHLGFLQAAAETGLLARCDYISAVSGGAYIACWLAATSRVHKSFSAVVDILQQSCCGRTGDSARENKAILHLRRHSNPLTPRLGFLADDPWTFASTYLRNFVVNLIAVMSLIAAIVVAPYVTLAILKVTSGDAQWLIACCCGLLALTTFALNIHLRINSNVPPPISQDGPQWYSTKRYSALCMFGPIYIGTLLLSWRLGQPELWPLIAALNRERITAAILGLSNPVLWVFLSLASVFFFFLFIRRTQPKAHRSLAWPGWARKVKEWGAISIALSLSGLFVALSTVGLFRFLLGTGQDSPNPAHAVPATLQTFTFGPSIIIVCSFLGSSVLVGYFGGRIREVTREWLAWFAGRTLLSAAIGLVVSCAAFYLPYWFRLIPESSFRLTIIIILAGFIAIGLRLIGEARQRTSRIAVFIVSATPFVFFSTLFLLLSWNLTFWFPQPSEGNMPSHWDRIETFSLTVAPMAFFLCIAFAIAWTWRIGNNSLSMHHFYRNQLTKCYLAAACKDGDNPDCQLADLNDPTLGLPMILLNGALNVSEGDELAWQERKAISFLMTPLHVGYVPMSTENRTAKTFSRTADYAYDRGITLSHAMAISGAALSPNKGYRTTRPIAFMMTLFNLRLGWWLPNTDSQTSTYRNRLTYLVRELIGHTSDSDPFIYVSDGGHFENTGLYQLARRRCKLVVVSDASEDSSRSFASFGDAIEPISGS